jgi:hypothetical protein
MVIEKRIGWVATGLTLQGGLEMLAGLALLVAASDSDMRAAETAYETLVQRFGAPVVVIGGGLKAYAGRLNRQLRGRRVGIAALLSAIPTAILVACAPTGLALLVYGILVYRAPAARQAFASPGSR